MLKGGGDLFEVGAPKKNKGNLGCTLKLGGTSLKDYFLATSLNQGALGQGPTTC